METARKLKQQNEIARDHAYQQSIEQEKNRNLQVKLQNEKLEKERAIEYSRLEHDKEMRLLNLCDNIGISQEFMNSFLDYLYDERTAYEEEKEKLNKLDSDIKKLKEKSSELFDTSYNSEQENDSIDTLISDYTFTNNILTINSVNGNIRIVGVNNDLIYDVINITGEIFKVEDYE